MRIKSVEVQNLRSIKQASINCNNLTALIGPNGSGKSTFLRALSLFYEPTASYDEDDFYNRNTEEDITVRVTFTELGEEARDRFGVYMAGEELSVDKVMCLPSKKRN